MEGFLILLTPERTYTTCPENHRANFQESTIKCLNTTGEDLRDLNPYRLKNRNYLQYLTENDKLRYETLRGLFVPNLIANNTLTDLTKANLFTNETNTVIVKLPFYSYYSETIVVNYLFYYTVDYSNFTMNYISNFLVLDEKNTALLNWSIAMSVLIFLTQLVVITNLTSSNDEVTQNFRDRDNWIVSIYTYVKKNISFPNPFELISKCYLYFIIIITILDFASCLYIWISAGIQNSFYNSLDNIEYNFNNAGIFSTEIKLRNRVINTNPGYFVFSIIMSFYYFDHFSFTITTKAIYMSLYDVGKIFIKYFNFRF